MCSENLNPNHSQHLSEALEALGESSGLVQGLIENLPGGAVFVLDQNLHYRLAAGEALAIWGCKSADFVGRAVWEALPPGFPTEYEGFCRQTLAGKPDEWESTCHGRTYRTRGTPLRSPNGEIHAVLVVFFDSTAAPLPEGDDQRVSFKSLQHHSASVSAELRETELLQQLSAKLLTEADIQVLYDEILTTAIALMRSDMGSLQLFDPERQELHLLAWKGFHPDSAAHWQTITTQSRSFCGAAVQKLERLIIPDIHTADWSNSNDNLQHYRKSGIVALQCTPILSHQGHPLGMISTYWRKPHRPQLRVLQVFDRLVSQVAHILESTRTEEALRENEAKYRTLFETMDQGFGIAEILMDETDRPIDYRMLEINPQFERLTGRSAQAFLSGRTVREVAPELEEEWYEFYGTVGVTGIPAHREIHAQAWNRWYQVSAYRTGTPEQRRVAILYSDITERKQAEEQLRRAAEFNAFRVLLNDAVRSLSDPEEIKYQAVCVLGQQLGSDRAYYVEIDEARSELIVGRDWHQPEVSSHTRRYPQEDWPMPWLVDGQPWVVRNVETDPALPDDQRSSYRGNDIGALVVVPLLKNGRLVATLAVNQHSPRDWTPDEIAYVQETADRTWVAIERATAEKALRQSEIHRIREQAAREEERQRAARESARSDALAELDRAKTRFFSNISHEFRTPITLILAPLEDVLEQLTTWENQPEFNLPSSPGQPLAPLKEQLELARRNSLRLLKLVNSLLDFSRIEAGRLEAVYEPTDLAQFTTELASLFRSAIERAGLTFQVDCQPLPPLYVDRPMWEKIVLNLLSNALKFTLTGDITLSLRAKNSHQAILSIQDTGPGIAREHLPHIFERFYQIRGIPQNTYEGSGIGLALVHELVRLQGGSVSVTSELGQGTTFTVTLPFGKAHLPPDRIQTPGNPRNSPSPAAIPYLEEAQGQISPEPSQTVPEPDPQTPTVLPHVLVVDDNADMRAYLTRILSSQVKVEAVADGTSALAALQLQPFDLILSDVMMPGLDGFGLLLSVRADPQTRELPVILLSARAGEEAIVAALEAQADDYIIKPFSAQELITRIKTHLTIKHLRTEALHQARTTLQRKDELLNVVSHELNTPLASILGWTRLLRATPQTPRMVSTGLNAIEHSAMMQEKLVQDLLDISRITANQLRLHLQPTELGPVIQRAIETVAQMAEEKGVELTWGETAAVVVQGDGDRLEQVLCNLLSNGIKFTPKGGRVNLDLSQVTHPGSGGGEQTAENDEAPISPYAEIRVTDTGIGIPPDFLPHLFEKFRQADEQHSHKGLGLGLAIAHHLVKLHQGTIQAHSAGVGQGAMFIIRLPRLPLPG